MAGQGVRVFTAGTQLSASQVQNYLMDQVVAYFADSAARDASFGGNGEPSLSEGRVCYQASDKKLYLYNGSAWIEIGAQLDDGEVITAKIADSAVTSAKIADGAITQAKLATGTPQAGFRSVQNAATTTSSNYTIQLTDLGKLVELNEASACTLTVPTNASVAFSVGDRIDVLQVGAGQVTITPVSGTVTINGYDGGLKLNGQWAAATLVKRATNTWVALGNLTT
jgi:hypothetical protein